MTTQPREPPGVTKWPMHDVAAGARFRLTRPMAPLPPAVEAEIDRLCQAATAAAVTAA